MVGSLGCVGDRCTGDCLCALILVVFVQGMIANTIVINAVSACKSLRFTSYETVSGKNPR